MKYYPDIIDAPKQLPANSPLAVRLSTIARASNRTPPLARDFFLQCHREFRQVASLPTVRRRNSFAALMPK